MPEPQSKGRSPGPDAPSAPLLGLLDRRLEALRELGVERLETGEDAARFRGSVEEREAFAGAVEEARPLARGGLLLGFVRPAREDGVELRHEHALEGGV